MGDEVLIRRAEVVRIHLDRLDELVLGRTPGVPEAVLTSLSLRFLFDGPLNQVAHAHGVMLHVAAPALDEVPLSQALFFACGGYELGGTEVAPHYLYREPGRGSQSRPQYEEAIAASPAEHSMSELKLKRFIAQPCLGILGTSLSRERTVRYVANKCGGAHHHDSDSKFEDIERLLTQAGNALTLSPLGISAVFAETLGTAWYLLRAPSVGELRGKLSGSD